MILSENIKKFRKDAGLTQKALASKSGLSFSMVSKLETGEQSNPSFETIRKIAVVLKISPGDLVNAPVTIEDQIDEYIEFKRGLKIPESIIKTVEYDEPCADFELPKKKCKPSIIYRYLLSMDVMNTGSIWTSVRN